RLSGSLITVLLLQTVTLLMFLCLLLSTLLLILLFYALILVLLLTSLCPYWTLPTVPFSLLLISSVFLLRRPARGRLLVIGLTLLLRPSSVFVFVVLSVCSDAEK